MGVDVSGAFHLVSREMSRDGCEAFGAGARVFKLELRERRTVSIEVGMQNSGLAVALASQFFTPAAALPGAVFSIWHNLSGSALAGWWSKRPPADGDDGDDG